MTAIIEYLVKKPDDVLWWDDYLLSSQSHKELANLLPKFKEVFGSGQDLLTIQTIDIDGNTRIITMIPKGATKETVEELWLWQAYRHEDLRPLLEFRSKYRSNYTSVTQEIKYQTQS